MKDFIAYVNLLTYAGVVPWASHYSGSIDFRGDNLDLRRKLTGREAARLNKQEREQGAFSPMWKAGDTSSRFDDKESALKAARAIFENDLRPRGAKLMIECAMYILDPRPVVAYAHDIAEVATELQKVSDEFERIGGWDGSEREAQRLADRWDELLQSVEEAAARQPASA